MKLQDKFVMAGDWIPIRVGLENEPEIIQLVALHEVTVSEHFGTVHMVVGACVRTWSIFDQHSQGGLLGGYTPEVLDKIIGILDWSKHLETVGWLEVSSEGLTMPGFETWLENSSKKRLSERRRKQSVRFLSAKKRTTGQDRTVIPTPHTQPPLNTQKRFIPPTVEQVRAYLAERKITEIDPERFVDFYEARGWRLSRGLAMKSWKAAVRTWTTRQASNGENGGWL
jgi:hypothetical protein